MVYMVSLDFLVRSSAVLMESMQAPTGYLLHGSQIAQEEMYDHRL